MKRACLGYSKLYIYFWPKISPPISWHVWDKVIKQEKWKTENTQHSVYLLAKIKSNFPRSGMGHLFLQRAILFGHSSYGQLSWNLPPYTEF